MEGLKSIPYIILILAIAGIVGGAVAIMNAQFGDSMTKCYNASFSFDTTTGQCLNATDLTPTAVGEGNANMTDEYYAITQSQSANIDVAEQLPTVAIISIMVIVISLIAGIFAYVKLFA